MVTFLFIVVAALVIFNLLAWGRIRALSTIARMTEAVLDQQQSKLCELNTRAATQNGYPAKAGNAANAQWASNEILNLRSRVNQIEANINSAIVRTESYERNLKATVVGPIEKLTERFAKLCAHLKIAVVLNPKRNDVTKNPTWLIEKSPRQKGK